MKTAKQPRPLHSRWQAGALALLLSCTAPLTLASADKAAKFYDDAQRRFDQGDLPGASIQLKNALQEDGNMLAAYLLQGKLLLRMADLKGAEAAFDQALKRGISRSEVALPMAQLYLLLGESKLLLDQISVNLVPPGQQPEVLTLRGQAYAMSGQMTLATQSFADARAMDPNSVAPLIAEAPLLLRGGDRDKAKALAVKATELAPQNAAAWGTLGMVLQGRAEYKPAMAAYDQALAINPLEIDSRVARVSLLFSLNREAEARAEVQAMRKASIIDPRLSFLAGLLASRSGDALVAKSAYSEAAGMVDAFPAAWRASSEPLLITGAMAHRALGNNEKAREYLEALVARNPRHYTGQVLLATTYFDTREYGRALPLLESLQRANPDDSQVLFLLGSVQLARKRYVQATELFEKAASRSGTPEIYRELGFSQLGLGHDQQGQANLEKAFAANVGDLRAGVQLAMTYARQGQPAKALQTAELIVKNDPGNLTMLNFLGNVKARNGDKKGARAVYEQVLAKDVTFRPAGISLSWMDIEDNRFDSARKRLTAMLNFRKDDPDVLFELGTLEQRANRLDDAVRYWQRSDEVQRMDPRPGLALLDLYSSQRQTEQALALARTLGARYTANLAVQLGLARAYLQANELQLARQTLQEATRIADFDADKQVLVGRLQLSAGNTDGASYNVSKALQSRPDDIGALVLAVEVAARRGDVAKIDAELKVLTNKYPQQVGTLLTRGHVALSRGQFVAAQKEYLAALDKEPSTPTAILVTQAMILSGETDKSVNFLDGWVAKHPNDSIALKALAEVQFQAGKGEAARKTYARVLATEPDDASTLNNFAGLLQRLSDPEAVKLAERAVKLAPNNPDYADTLGWILVQRGDVEGGVRYLREARLRNPLSGDIRYHLAVGLAKIGRRAEAKDELQAALAGPSRIPPGPEVNRLKAELGL